MKPVLRILKCIIGSGDANVAPPLGPLLGQFGVNIKDFCIKFNDFTKNMDLNLNLIVTIIIYKDKTFSFSTNYPPLSFLLFEEEFLTRLSALNYNVKKPLLINYEFLSLLNSKNLLLMFKFFDSNLNFFFFYQFVYFFASQKFFSHYYSQILFLHDFFFSGKFFSLYKPNIAKTSTFVPTRRSFLNYFLGIRIFRNVQLKNIVSPNNFPAQVSYFLQFFSSLSDNSNLEEDGFFFLPKKIFLSTIMRIVFFRTYNSKMHMQSVFKMILSSLISMHITLIDDL